MTAQKISWKDLQDNQDLRRRHYLDMYVQILNIDLFIDRLSKAFQTNSACSIYFELGEERLVQLEVWAIPEIPDAGADLLEWVASWAAARKHQLNFRMMEMREKWPYLEPMRLKEAYRAKLSRRRHLAPITAQSHPFSERAKNKLKRAFKRIFGRSQQKG